MFALIFLNLYAQGLEGYVMYWENTRNIDDHQAICGFVWSWPWRAFRTINTWWQYYLTPDQVCFIFIKSSVDFDHFFKLTIVFVITIITAIIIIVIMIVFILKSPESVLEHYHHTIFIAFTIITIIITIIVIIIIAGDSQVPRSSSWTSATLSRAQPWTSFLSRSKSWSGESKVTISMFINFMMLSLPMSSSSSWLSSPSSYHPSSLAASLGLERVRWGIR